jgi:hypothetical protein
MTDINNNKPKFYCETCNYGCNHNSVFIKHTKSDKHLRQGKKKTFNCDKCEYKTDTSHWNLKMHMISKHYTVEEKSKQKYYCSICDSVFFSPLFYKNHIKSILHINNSLLNNKSINNNMNYNNKLDSKNTSLNELKEEIKLELKTELKLELKKEIMLEIKKMYTH